MPELPEVEHLRLTLERHLLGVTVESVELGCHDVLDVSGLPRTGRTGRLRPWAGADPVRAAALLAGGRIESLRRHGKQMAVTTADGRVLVIQLGMSGRMTVSSDPPTRQAKNDDPHAHVTWRCRVGRRDGLWVVFRDPRRFGGLTALPGPAELHERWSLLGPDALLASPTTLGERLASVRRSVKAALLDQAVVAGVGNIYADESLYRSGIHPITRLDRLSDTKRDRLVAELQGVLAAAVASGGSTLRDYVDGDAREGGYQSYHLIYGRAGEACRRCGDSFRGSVVAGRTTVQCPTCQPLIHKGRGEARRTRR